MCGIAGYIDFNGKRTERKIIEKMCSSIVHRGPDSCGVFVKENLALGMQRLSIIDLKTGQQPIYSEDKRYCIVFNGEIYNYKCIKEELVKKGHVFSSHSDTEVIVHLYEDYGVRCLDKLEGMFAIAIWDSFKKELFLARDRMGKKPLYYSTVNNKFIFASEIKAILINPASKKELSLESLEKFLFFGFVPTPKTMFKDIYKVPAGAYLVLRKDKKFEIDNYWEPDFSRNTDTVNEREIENSCLELIKKSVKKRLVSDVSLGTFLSGGVDSSLVTAIMSEILGPDKVDTFTIGFTEGKHDESIYAKQVARYLKIKNHHLKIFSVKECLEIVPEILDFMDAPIADPSIIPTFLLSRFTRQNVKVALSGDGGDELFAGYPKYYAHQLAKKFDFLGNGVKKTLGGLISKGFAFMLDNKKRSFFSDMHQLPHIRNHLWIAPFSPEKISRILETNCGNNIFEDIESYYQNIPSADLVSQMLYLDGKLTFSDLYLVKVDRASMANSLEVRCPFLDKDLMEYVNSISTYLKIKDGETKHLLKKIASRYIPEDVIYRKKMGFGIPLKEWTRNGLKDIIYDYLSDKKIKDTGLFAEYEVERIMNEHYSGKKDNSMALWTLFIFQYWYYHWFV